MRSFRVLSPAILTGVDRREPFEEGVQYEHVKNLKPEAKPYYQALIDNRDIPYVVGVQAVGG